ncbi:allophycocyanin [Aetokthonos hydrillicola Thurmond2011]|jgi:allophycocyanin alpha subunit|uniref:Allophycocyanin n=1 Tax=Aetokthonos hydrillicola Thurmond2011 TaxID=2712845 RepID=A0AAP5IEE2_9CYAN|nr:allophycocyanin [Aetokthonos hydrillicola]MBW4591191.1 allophycocyanin [Aetokthonos hydrillicola CCALA 1050]MDR9899714.1 allophycocyanin [Aetokthonos hydrillicola Thurmond2011]
MSIITKMILNADAEIRYLTPGELDQINMFVKSSERRLSLVQTLTGSHDRIVKQAANELFQTRPKLVSPGGNAYGKEMTATCLRDMDYYLRLITYSVVAGDTTPIEEIGIIGVRQMYRSLGTPIESVAESVRAMKNIVSTMLSAEDSSEVGGYFDYLISALQ